MATTYETLDLIDQFCVGGSGGGGGAGGRNSPIQGDASGQSSPTAGNPSADCGAGLYIEIWQWNIAALASDGDLSVARIPYMTIDDGASPYPKPEWFLGANIQAFCNDTGGDAGYNLFELIPVQGGRFNGIKLGGNSDIIQWHLDTDVDQDWIDVVCNYVGGTGEKMQNAVLSGTTSQLADLDIAKWTMRALLWYWYKG